jgi:hypothetical protein
MPKIRWQRSFAFPETRNKYRDVELENAVIVANLFKFALAPPDIND